MMKEKHIDENNVEIKCVKSDNVESCCETNENNLEKAKKDCNFSNEVKRAYEYRKNGYTIKDSALAFLVGGFCSPLIAVLAISILFAIVSSISGMEYATLIKTRPYDIIAMLCAEIGFAVYFLIIQFKKPSNLLKSLTPASTKNYTQMQKRKFSNCIGLSFKKFDFLICALVVLIAIVMSLLCAQFIELVNYGLHSIGYTKDSSLPFSIDSVDSMLLGLLTMALIPAVCEEFLFRGVVLGGLLNGAKTKKARILCVVLSALMFAFIHQSALQFIYPFIMGCVFGLVYMYTGNLLYSIILHFVSNGVVVVANYINSINGVTSTAINFNASFVLGAIALLILALVLSIGGILLIKFICKNKSQFVQNEKEINEYANHIKKQEVMQFENEEEGKKQMEINEKIENTINEKTSLIGKIVLYSGFAFGFVIIVIDLLTTILGN